MRCQGCRVIDKQKLQRRLTRPTANSALVAIAVVTALFLAELALRAFFPESRGYYVLAPDDLLYVEPLPGAMPGVEGRAEFRTNAHGIRGRAFGADEAEYRILALGGSTSHNVYLDQSEAWPLLVEELLGPTTDGRRTWSGSGARSGSTTRTNLLQFRHLVPSLPRIDAVVMLIGVNDLGAALRQGWGYRTPPPLSDPNALAIQMQEAFLRVPGPLHTQFTGYSPGDVPFYKRQALWHLARMTRDAWVARYGESRQDPFGGTLATWRAHRSESPLIHDSLPPLDAPLAEYRGYLETIVEMGAEYGVRVIFMTQPVLWREDLSSAEKALLWMGGSGDFQNVAGQAYYSPAALAEGMRAYNEVLLDVCRTSRAECVDLAAAVPADTTMFYDDVHPTERGSRIFAETLSDYLDAHPPYAARVGSP
jgi:lysophospholipase L1-like esterase